MSNDVIHFGQLLEILRRHAVSSSIVIIVCSGLCVAAAFLVPKRFISRAVLTVEVAYFKIPLVGDLVAGANDSAEFRAQRESLLRYALSNEFLDQLGRKYDEFEFPLTDRRHVLERDRFLRRIEYFAKGSDSYQISVSGRSAEAAYEMTEAVIERMMSTLINERMGKLLRARAAIQNSLDSLKGKLAQAEASSGGRDSGLEETVEDAERKLNSLAKRFTDSHPAVVEQRNRVRRLRSDQLKGTSLASADSISGSKKSLQEMYDDLFKKLSYLNIVIDMENSTINYPYLSVIERADIPASPAFPKKRVFGLVGLAAGILLAFLLLVVRELRRGTFANPQLASELFDAPYLGSLPYLRMETAMETLPPPLKGPADGGLKRVEQDV